MKKILFVLDKADSESATRCFLFAKIAHQSGHDVNIFLIDEGVHWAVKGVDGSTRCKTGDCVNEHLPFLVENNVPVGVCLPCAKGKELIDISMEASTFNF